MANGAAGVVVSAVLAALVAAGVSVVLHETRAPGRAAGAPEPDPATAGDLRALREEVRRLRAALDARTTAAPGSVTAPPDPAATAPGEADDAGTGTAGAGAAADALPATVEDLRAFVDRRIAESAAAAAATNAGRPATTERRRVTIDEAGQELGLSGTEVETVRRIWRETEEELLETLFGTTDIERIRRDVEAIRDDPERRAAFVQQLVTNAVSNAGRLLTLESKRDARLGRVLDADRVRRLKGYDIRSTLADDDLQALLDEVF